MKKKLLSILLVLTMMLSLMPTAMAAQGSDVLDLRGSLSGERVSNA